MDGIPLLPDDKISDTWDYTDLIRQISFILEAGRFHLLETAGRFVTRYLMLPNLEKNLPIHSMDLALTKFDIFGRAEASVGIQAEANEFQYRREITSWGWVDVIDENSRMGLYRLNLHPGQRIDNHYHNKTREAEFILTSGIELTNGSQVYRVIKPDEVFHWETGQCHGYQNTGKSVANILCIDEPPFKPGDEIIQKVSV